MRETGKGEEPTHRHFPYIAAAIVRTSGIADGAFAAFSVVSEKFRLKRNGIAT
ncbi:hypothetical protein [Sphingomonas sp. SUN039]|uniref:hypothetical protein n=1 Tax=Sphingomonas sp. SUN039 TaxID=2937787 RepID=UPI002164AF84|nr:hypothetical protein [Sphingomonas sp. SUN039]UVO52654.1 hypothetical protein M0209_00390 [Sphingomonas sp. SUN039]